jgi:hypothetical protein
MKKLAVGILLLWPHLALAQYQPPTYINPSPNGGYVITQPGSNHPPIYVEPMPQNRGVPYAPRYQVVQPGANPYQPPVYISPSSNGGVVITQPGR